MECGYLLFIKSSLENVNDYKKVIIASILISSAFVIMDTFCILTLFPCLQNGQNLLSLYLSTKLIRINAYKTIRTDYPITQFLDSEMRSRQWLQTHFFFK